MMSYLCSLFHRKCKQDLHAVLQQYLDKEARHMKHWETLGASYHEAQGTITDLKNKLKDANDVITKLTGQIQELKSVHHYATAELEKKVAELEAKLEKEADVDGNKTTITG